MLGDYIMSSWLFCLKNIYQIIYFKFFWEYRVIAFKVRGYVEEITVHAPGDTHIYGYGAVVAFLPPKLTRKI